MCGRYALSVSPEALQIFIGLIRLFTFPARYNIAPTQEAPVVRLTDQGRELHDLRWGLIPSWSREKPKAPLINARTEGIFEKPSFRVPIRRQRCLVPASGFYEWTPSRQGLLFRLVGEEPMVFGGIWDRWAAPDATVESFSILTTTANGPLSAIHDRMPVILPPDAWEAWLDPSSSPDRIRSLAVPAPDDALKSTAVGPRVNSARNEGPACWDP